MTMISGREAIWPGRTRWLACHGAALASAYTTCMDFTWESAIPQFAKLARILNPSLHDGDGNAADSLKQLGAPKEELPALAKQSMVPPDYTRYPRVPSATEILSIIRQSFTRQSF